MLVAFSLAACGGSSARPSPKPASAQPLAHVTVSSPDLPGTVPRQFTCDGGSRIPRVQWTSAGSAVKEWALEMLDPDAAGTFVHWLVYSIPAASTSLGPPLPAGALEGTNGRGQAGYTGPCPPPGPEHHYHFIVSGLDSALGLPAGLSRTDLEAKLGGHVTARGELVATYRRSA